MRISFACFPDWCSMRLHSIQPQRHRDGEKKNKERARERKCTQKLQIRHTWNANDWAMAMERSAYVACTSHPSISFCISTGLCQCQYFTFVFSPFHLFIAFYILITTQIYSMCFFCAQVKKESKHSLGKWLIIMSLCCLIEEREGKKCAIRMA